MEQSTREKKQLVVLTIVIVVGFALVAAAVFLPIINSLRQKGSEVAFKEKQLADAGFESGIAPLESLKTTEHLAYNTTQETWAKVKARLKNLNDYYFEHQDVRGVDYLSSVARERTLLESRAREVGLQLPRNLGMPDEVKTEDDAATMLMQLKIVSAIVQAAIDERVGKIASIEPLPPVSHKLEGTTEPYFKEFPIRVEFETQMEPFFRFVYRASTNEFLLAVRGVRLEKATSTGDMRWVNEEDPKLRAMVVVDGIVVLKDPEQVKAAPSAAPKNLQPQGH